MGKMTAVKLFIAHIRRSVSPKGQHMIYMNFFQLGGYRINIFFFGAHTGHVRQRHDMKLVLYIGGNFHGFFRFTAAGAIGNTDEIRLKDGKGIQHGKGIGEFVFLFGRKTSKESNCFFRQRDLLSFVFPRSI